MPFKAMAMIGCGTTTYTDPDDYRLNVPGAAINLVLTGSAPFRARVTWLNTRRLRLVLVDEIRPRIAFASLAPASVFVSFPLRGDPPAVWDGVEVRRGDIVLHGHSGCFHQRTVGATRWGLIALSRDDLAAYCRTLLEVELVPPPAAKFLRRPAGAMAGLLRLHTQACRLAKTTPDMIAHREVARALEQDLIHALVNCLKAEEVLEGAGTRHRHAETMARFERVLALQGDRQLPMSELCAGTGVSERTLRVCCADFLGMSPTAYARLRRLNLVRSALLRNTRTTATIGTVARKYGFSELGRFAAAYRLAFGESPSATLQGGHATARDPASAGWA
jgi:AraC-like DNA-binding protein